MTQRLDKKENNKVRGPSSKLVTNGPEAQNNNKHSSPDKSRRLQSCCNMNLTGICVASLHTATWPIHVPSWSLLDFGLKTWKIWFFSKCSKHFILLHFSRNVPKPLKFIKIFKNWLLPWHFHLRFIKVSILDPSFFYNMQ